MVVIIFGSIWFVFAYASAIVAGSRGRSSLFWFLASFLLTPVVLIILYVLPPLNQSPLVAREVWAEDDDTQNCPVCAERVLAAALECGNCGVIFDDLGVKQEVYENRRKDDRYTAWAVFSIIGLFLAFVWSTLNGLQNLTP